SAYGQFARLDGAGQPRGRGDAVGTHVGGAALQRVGVLLEALDAVASHVVLELGQQFARVVPEKPDEVAQRVGTLADSIELHQDFRVEGQGVRRGAGLRGELALLVDVGELGDVVQQ